MFQNTHCILDVSIASIERLHKHQIYPIVLLLKFKDRAQIKEVKDSRYPSDKIGTKAAKEMFEQALKIEAEYKHYISGKQIYLKFKILNDNHKRYTHTLMYQFINCEINRSDRVSCVIS